jgi:hypothetical protein
MAGLRRGSIPNTVPKPDVRKAHGFRPRGVRDILPPALEAAAAVSDLLTEIRRDIDRRLDELGPVRDELRRLEQARDALAAADGSRPRRRATSADAGSGRTRMTRAQSREIDKRVLALLKEDSAQRPAALAMLTETSVGSMNARLNRLVRDGKLKKRKRGRSIRYQAP